MYKKHRAFVLTSKSCVYLQSPLNIKFGIYTKNKSKTFIFSSVINRNVSAYNLPYVSYTNRCMQFFDSGLSIFALTVVDICVCERNAN